eukprot:7490110-Ditylum_brightwellii.AAC.1
MVQCEKYLYRSKEDLYHGNLPTCVLVSIDMENMFNSMSQAQCQRIIVAHFPDLTSTFDSIYQSGNIIYYQTSDGAIRTIIQKEGVAQGCSWSSILSALALGEAIIKVKAAILECQQS